MTGPQLIILAAGLGRRFGGLKQLMAVGPDGSAIMDYTVFDALREGFGEVVLVIRRETEDLIRAHVDAGFGRHVPVRYVHQDMDDVPGTAPAGRTRPWGTVHAVLAADGVVNRSFAVANADDHYGRPAVAALAAHLNHHATWCMVGYAATDTLPDSGAVSRGLVQTDGDHLRSIREVHTLRRHADGAAWDGPDGLLVIPGRSLVSMNLWGFGLDAMALLREHFAAFVNGDPDLDDECYLPEAVGRFVADEQARVTVLDARSPWCGMTAAIDLDTVRATMRGHVEAGTYPARLWP